MAYVTIPPALQAFYAARGMWANGRPCSTLAGWLGQQAPWGRPDSPQHFVTPEQLALLMADIAANGPRGLNGWQVAQTLRRMREAAARSGRPLSLSPVAASSPTVPFGPLVCPPAGKAKEAFVRHLMQCLRDVVSFSQESTY